MALAEHIAEETEAEERWREFRIAGDCGKGIEMADRTSIEWTEASWNPIIATVDPDNPTGPRVRGWHCVHASDGCRNCYAETLNKRLGTGLAYTAQNTQNVQIAFAEGGQSGIDWPLRAKKSRRIFVASMTDLFGDWVPDEMIDRVFAVMALAHQHTFQVLTKRAERMRKYVSRRVTDQKHVDFDTLQQWPLPNVWLGVSCEDQATADERIPLLLQTPAAVRWVSYEPALSSVDFTQLAPSDTGYFFSTNALTGEERYCDTPPYGWSKRTGGPRLDWIVVGGESGPGARSFNIAWARQTIQQCREASVPVFVKQLGAKPYADRGELWRIGPRGERRIIRDKKGGDISEWPEDLRVRQYPEASDG